MQRTQRAQREAAAAALGDAAADARVRLRLDQPGLAGVAEASRLKGEADRPRRPILERGQSFGAVPLGALLGDTAHHLAFG